MSKIESKTTSFMLTTQHIQSMDLLIKSLTALCLEYDINPDSARNKSLHTRAALTIYDLLINPEDWRCLISSYKDAADFEEHIVIYAKKKISNLAMIASDNTTIAYQVEPISGAIAIGGQEFEIVLKPK